MATQRAAEKTWRFVEVRDGEAVFGCKFPQCAYEHHDPGGVHLHYIKKHGSSPGRVPVLAGANREQQRQGTGTVRNPQQTKHKHSWRLLKPSNQDERNAIAAGATEVCETCEELR